MPKLSIFDSKDPGVPTSQMILLWVSRLKGGIRNQGWKAVSRHNVAPELHASYPARALRKPLLASRFNDTAATGPQVFGDAPRHRSDLEGLCGAVLQAQTSHYL